MSFSLTRENHLPPATPAISPRFSFLTIAEQGIRKRLDALLQNEDGVRTEEDINALHDMRVASRRLREAFRIFGPLFSRKRLKPLNSTARQITKALGTVREVDVNLEQLQRWKEHPAAIHSLAVEALVALELARQRRLRARVQTRLERISLQDFRTEVLKMVQHARGKSRQNNHVAVPQTAISPVSFAGPHIDEGLKSIHAALDRVAAHPTPHNYHLLRIGTKKFRYTVELLSRAFKPGRAARIGKQLKRLQDELGLLHDGAVLHHRIRELRVELRSNGLDHLERELLRLMRRIAHEQAEIQVRVDGYLRRLERRRFFKRIPFDLRLPGAEVRVPIPSNPANDVQS